MQENQRVINFYAFIVSSEFSLVHKSFNFHGFLIMYVCMQGCNKQRGKGAACPPVSKPGKDRLPQKIKK